MVAYQQFVALSESGDSEERSQAAYYAACAFVNHAGPADEQAALYASLVCFLDDASVKVRAALAYGLLRARCAPRPVMVSLLHDAPVIARAVAQYSPVLIDADLLGLVKSAEEPMLDVIAERMPLSTRVAEALIARRVRAISLKVLRRGEIAFPAAKLIAYAREFGTDGGLRGALLSRKDLPAIARMALVREAKSALLEARIVKGAVAPNRLDRLMRNAMDNALSAIGEREAIHKRQEFAAEVVNGEQVSMRVLLHAITSGHVLFFAECIGQLAGSPRAKVFALLNAGSRAALNALFARCGIGEAVRNLLARLVFHARDADLADDLAARHFVVTALIEDLIAEHDGDIPEALEESFAYLNEQNILLARRAARGVMPAFAETPSAEKSLPAGAPIVALPAA